MKRLSNSAGQQPTSWLFFLLRLRKRFKFRYILVIFVFFMVATYLQLLYTTPSIQFIITKSEIIIEEELIIINDSVLHNCNQSETESLYHFSTSKINYENDKRPKPTIERLYKLFQILTSHEQRFRQIFDYLGIFRFNNFYNTLRPYANNTEQFQTIACLFQKYMNISNGGHIIIKENLIDYLNQVSNYLSDGFRSSHLSWNESSKERLIKPVIILAANTLFFHTLQASMRTIDQHLKNYTVAIYDLGFTAHQVTMIKDNCARCIIIEFPFSRIETISGHIRTLGNFAWKPIVIQDALQRFGSIIYGDTSVRYKTSDFNRLLIDNLIRGFSCRELPGHYLPCFTYSRTFSWFNETYSTFDDTYIAEAGFVAVNDNFLSRLILKTWVTCALDLNCIAPPNSQTQCKRVSGATMTHRYDQSAMVITLSYYFFPSRQQHDKIDPAPYDMFTSIQKGLADVRRFEGDNFYFTRRALITTS